MTSLFLLEIEHEDGAVLSSSVGNLSPKDPFFLCRVAINERLPEYPKLSAHLRKLEKEEAEKDKASTAYDNQQSLKDLQ